MYISPMAATVTKSTYRKRLCHFSRVNGCPFFPNSQITAGNNTILINSAVIARMILGQQLRVMKKIAANCKAIVNKIEANSISDFPPFFRLKRLPVLTIVSKIYKFCNVDTMFLLQIIFMEYCSAGVIVICCLYFCIYSCLL